MKKILIIIGKTLLVIFMAVALLFTGFVIGDTTQMFRTYNSMKIRTVYRDTCLQINLQSQK